jgi:hypothetical protein
MRNEIDKTDNRLKILNLVAIERSLLSWIYADVVTEAVTGFHVFVVVNFDELFL